MEYAYGVVLVPKYQKILNMLGLSFITIDPNILRHLMSYLEWTTAALFLFNYRYTASLLGMLIVGIGSKNIESSILNLPVIGEREIYPVALFQAGLCLLVFLLPASGGKEIPLLGVFIAATAIYVVQIGMQPHQAWTTFHYSQDKDFYVCPGSIIQAIIVLLILVVPNLSQQVGSSPSDIVMPAVKLEGQNNSVSDGERKKSN
jgi:hypothetical protein